MTARTVPTALVTGGAGFIGTWVLRELFARGVRPVALDLHPAPERWRAILGQDASRLTFVEADLTDLVRLRDVFDQFEITHIIHLAALLTPACQQDPLEGCRVNVLGSMTLFELARQRAERLRGFSYASSYAVYGSEPDEVAGSAAGGPATFYGVFKQAVDLIAEQYWNHFGIASVAIRPHVVYGPEREVGLTAGPSLAARAAAIGGHHVINYRGSVSYDYVEDVAGAFVLGSLATPPGANVVDLPGERVTPERFIEVIDGVVPGSAGRLAVDGPEIAPNIPTNPKFITRLFPGWRATSLAEGVRRTVAFYRTGGGKPGEFPGTSREGRP